jgi:hypothetical protein
VDRGTRGLQPVVGDALASECAIGDPRQWLVIATPESSMHNVTPAPICSLWIFLRVRANMSTRYVRQAEKILEL